MDVGNAASRARHPRARPHAVNAYYTATADGDGDGILIRTLSDKRNRQYLKLGTNQRHYRTILSFHPTRPSLLAATLGAHLAIFDVETTTVKHQFRGNGRIITSISFAQSDCETIATGTADGTICIWSVKDTARPRYLLRGVRNACRHVAVHPLDASLIASAHGTQAMIWRLPNARPVMCTSFNLAALQAFTWCPSGGARIIAVNRNGMACICDVKSAVDGASLQDGSFQMQDSEEQDLEPLNVHAPQHTVSSATFKLGPTICQAQVLGQNGLVILPCTSKDLYFHNYSLEDGKMTELWRLHKEAAIECFSFRSEGNSLEVMIISETTVEIYKVPGPVLDSMGWSRQMYDGPSESNQTQTPSTGAFASKSSCMRPQKRIRRKRSGPDVQNSNSLRRGKRRINGADNRLKLHASKREQRSRPESPVTKSMTSSLELPKERTEEDEEASPMPFLSPNIPARKVSPGLITPLDDSVQLPPLAMFHANTAVADMGHESDSDDETFAGDMKGSGTFLPGGVNVPLPRTCGAAFSANGQLVTFFPYSVKPSLNHAHVTSKSPTSADKHGDEINELFPGFGNLAVASTSRAPPSETGTSLADEELTTSPLNLAIQPSSFDGKPPWGLKTSPTKPNAGPLLGERRVNVSIRNLEMLTPMRQSLAETYGLYEDESSGSDLCYKNAELAAEEGLFMSARAWRLLAIILEPSTVKSVGLDGLSDLLALVASTQDEPLLQSFGTGELTGLSKTMIAKTNPLLDLPIGRCWAAELLFAWAEARADIQLLACMSTLFAKTCDTFVTDARTSRHRSPSVLQTVSRRPTGLALGSSNSNNVSSLYTDQMMVQALGHSPNKLHPSRLSSGNPSQPTTPYLDSSNSTPPFAFSLNTRQTTKFFRSGSASPERQRSSFSAAAKNYAASIADKFGSYGSSPPSRKLGTSPGNELSSSLPTAAGSWSKSVSFASTLDSAQTSKQSLSLAQEDDSYDSDRTVEDNNMVQVSRKSNTGVMVTKKDGSFFDEKSKDKPTRSIPEQLVIKGGIWRQQYAEHLRTWNMLRKAAEMANVTRPGVGKTKTIVPSPKDVVPQTASGRRHNTCTICYCIVRAAEQICPVCLHTTHPGCLDDYIAALESDHFACPSGCGCDCASAAHVTFTLENTPAKEVYTAPKLAVKKRPSLTNPLYLRQKLEGESW